jgi:hypothetical protein
VPAWAGAGRGRVLALLAVVVGLLLVAVAGVAIGRGQTVSEVGSDDVARFHSPDPAGSPEGADRATIPVTDGRALPTSTAIPPTTLRIPAIGLTAQVDQVGITAATGEFDVPPSVDRVGWYRYGPGLEATAGSVVIAGHVDSVDQGHGAFFRLPALSPGDLVEVGDGTGATYPFEVVGRTVYDKSEIPLERYFARDGEVRLTLITCGGEFDPGAGRYRDNIVVTAVPVT